MPKTDCEYEIYSSHSSVIARIHGIVSDWELALCWNLHWEYKKDYDWTFSFLYRGVLHLHIASAVTNVSNTCDNNRHEKSIQYWYSWNPDERPPLFKLFRNMLCPYSRERILPLVLYGGHRRNSWCLQGVLTARTWDKHSFFISAMLTVWNASLSVKIGINYPQAITSMKPMKFTVLYTATIKRGKPLLRRR